MRSPLIHPLLTIISTTLPGSLGWQRETTMLQILIGLLIGLIIGWLAEWVLDWRFWRSDVDAYSGESSRLQEQLRDARAEISRLRSQIGYVESGDTGSGDTGSGDVGGSEVALHDDVQVYDSSDGFTGDFASAEAPERSQESSLSVIDSNIDSEGAQG